LSTEEWARVLGEAARLGVLQAGFSGGEPLARRDLEEIIAAARAAGLYTNVLTSGVGLDAARAARLREAGLQSMQLSIQADEPILADEVAGARVHRLKLDAARIIREAGFAFGMNVVLHRGNIDRLREIVTLVDSLGADRLELANVQFYGWAWANRARLLPTRAQVEQAARLAEELKRAIRSTLQIFYVLPDYFGTRPKPCMNGWGRRYISVNPIGEVLPCPTASGIPGLRFEQVREKSLEWIWRESESFNRFRGTEWMPEPCQSCPERERDFGGCRCQAALITGDANATDPVCALAPGRPLVDRILEESETAATEQWVPRVNPIGTSKESTV
jgi:pyrroloquinoline quinone biosynthesis protein E